jgi:hypothetical protein
MCSECALVVLRISRWRTAEGTYCAWSAWDATLWLERCAAWRLHRSANASVMFPCQWQARSGGVATHGRALVKLQKL